MFKLQKEFDMKPLKIIGLLILTVFLTRCTTTAPVVTDYDREADFGQYTTFYWSDDFQIENGANGEEEPLFYNTLVKKRLKQAIQSEMEGRGYTLSSDDPDLLINSHVVVQEKNTTRYNYPYYYGYYPFGYNNFPVRNYKEGDIVIDLIDKDQHQLVWQGYASGVLDTQTSDREEEIREAVSLIFSKYNHRAGESREMENVSMSPNN